MNIKRIAILSAVVIAVICVNMLSLFDWDHDPVAKQGVMDLRGWTEGATKPLKLKGEWEFYPGQLLSKLPENQPASFPYIQTPGNWGKSLNADNARNAIGYGTYRLTVVMDARQAGQIAFRVPLIRSAHRLIVDGQEIGAKGIVATDPAQYFGQAVPYVAWKKIAKERFDIFVQVVNFDHAVSGGIIQPISMGPVDVIIGEHQRIAALDFAILVVYLLFTLYFGLLHFFDRKNSWEWLSLFFFFLAVVVSVNSTKWLSYLLPFLSFHATVTIYWIASIGLNYCVFLFVYRRYQRRVDKWLKKLVLLISCAFIGMILVFPPDQATQYIAAWNLVSTLMYIFILVLLIWSLRSKEEGAWYEFLAFCLFASEALLNALIIFGITEQGGWYFFQNFSFLVVISFLFLQQVILAYRKTQRITQEMLLVDKFKNEFMASISEQMVTPLNAMISIADARLHEDDKLTPDQRHDLRIITSVGWTIRSMVNDLLDFSRLRNKTMLLQVRPIDFRSVVNEGIERLYYLDFDHSVLFENKIPLGFPPILADEERMDQLLMSILIHAQKKVIRGKIIIEASVKEPFADISIRLQGEGMTEQVLREIVFLLTEERQDATIPTDNTVLSLLLVRTLVDMHGGLITVHADSPEDVVYRLAIPLANTGQQEVSRKLVEAALPKPTMRADRVSAAPSGEGALGEAEILVVDDDALNLKVLLKQLSLDQYRVTIARDGREAMQILGNRMKMDLVIIDRTLTGMSGLELCRKIREQYSLFELPILLLTSGGYADHAIAANEAGANDFLTKPIESAELRVRVRTLLQLKRSIGDRIRMELAFLQAQIKPHFLFNTLNSIASLSRSEPDRMASLLNEFGQYLRESFRFENSEPLIPFERELALVRSYLHIEKVRFEDWLSYQIEISTTTDFLIPPLTLQTLVENAIRHGIMQQAEGGHVLIRVYRTDEHVCVAVEDDGVGIAQDVLEHLFTDSLSGGIGLKNIERRLRQLFGQGLRINSAQGTGTEILIRLPLEKVGISYESNHRG